MSARSVGLAAGLAALLGVAAAQGKECEGVAFDEQIQDGGGTLALNGLGLRQATFLKVDVYVAALYLPKTSTDANAILGANAPSELVLHFVRDVDRGDLNKGWDEGFEHNAKDQLPALKERIETFKGLMPDMKTGQRLTFVSMPGQGVQVELDGAARGKIAGDDFARALLAIWLGAHPPNEELKAGLLGGECS
ncbi:MAG: chalcone isomerase family protein [Gammaproteobacteria bacterium]|nr:chalcone isomerase family protein [Gammaproteobacteria bacterium]